jgi:ABC-type branched-subunit amino acid transport system ATPase component
VAVWHLRRNGMGKTIIIRSVMGLPALNGGVVRLKGHPLSLAGLDRECPCAWRKVTPSC